MQLIPEPFSAAVIIAVMMTIPFLVTFFALRMIIFVPLLQYVEERQQVIDTARREAEELARQNDERMATVREKLDSARTEVIAFRASARANALEEERHLIEEARLDSQERIEDAVLQIEHSRDEASTVMRQSATQLSTDIVAQVLGREVEASEGA